MIWLFIVYNMVCWVWGYMDTKRDSLCAQAYDLNWLLGESSEDGEVRSKERKVFFISVVVGIVVGYSAFISFMVGEHVVWLIILSFGLVSGMVGIDTMHSTVDIDNWCLGRFLYVLSIVIAVIFSICTVSFVVSRLLLF